MFADSKPDRKTWYRILGPESLLERRLNEVIAQRPSKALSEIILGWDWLKNGREGLDELCGIGERLERADPERLFQNVQTHFAARVSAWLLPDLHSGYSEEFLVWLSRTAGISDGTLLPQTQDLLRLELSPVPSERLNQILAVFPNSEREITGLLRLRLLFALHTGDEALRVDGKPLRFPIATVNATETRGYIFDLHLRSLNEGQPDLLEHPMMWKAPIGREWIQELEKARKAAHLDKPIIWWLTYRGRGQNPWIAEGVLQGTSHTAATRAAFSIQKANGDFDPNCLIAADLDDSGATLLGVEGLDAKCRAARESGITSIVLAKPKKQTINEMSKLHLSAAVRVELQGSTNPVQIFDFEKLGKAIDQATGFSTGLRRYLEWVYDQVDQHQPPFIGGRKLSNLYVEPDVLKENRTIPDEQRESVWTAKIGAVTDKDASAPYNQTHPRRERVGWQNECRTVRRAVVIGFPGEGKTILSRMTVREIAKEGLRQLDAINENTTNNHSLPLKEIPTPIWLRMPDLGCGRGSIEDAILSTLPTSPAREFPASVKEHLKTSIFAANGWLVLDALDEVPSGNRSAVRMQLERLHDSSCHLLITTRPFDYDRTWIPFDQVTEYELAPLSPRQQYTFLEEWFNSHHDSGRENTVRGLLQHTDAFGGIAANALLLTLICFLAQQRDLQTNGLRRVDVFRLIVRDLYRQAWKDRPLPDDLLLSRKLHIVQAVAWHLFKTDPARTIFDDSNDWLSAIDNVSNSSQVMTDDTLIKDLVASGLVVPTGQGTSSFMHRMFLEYLAAAHVARLPSPISEVNRFLWRLDTTTNQLKWEPAAEEFITFLAGTLDDPTELLAHLQREDATHPDALYVMARLAGRCLLDARYHCIPQLLLTSTVARAENAYYSLGKTRQVARSLAHAAGAKYIESRLTATETPTEQAIIDLLLLLVQFGHRGATPALLEVLTRLINSDRPYISQKAAIALGSVGVGATVTGALEVLLQRCLYGDTPLLGKECAEALGGAALRPHISFATQRLVVALRSPEWATRFSAASMIRALGTIASCEEVRTVLLDGLRGDGLADSSMVGLVQCEIADAFCSVGLKAIDASEVETLFDILQNSEPHLKTGAARVLGNLPAIATTPRVIGALAEWALRDDETLYGVQASARDALVSLVRASPTSHVITPLENALRVGDTLTHLYAMDLLGRFVVGDGRDERDSSMANAFRHTSWRQMRPLAEKVEDLWCASPNIVAEFIRHMEGGGYRRIGACMLLKEMCVLECGQQVIAWLFKAVGHYDFRVSICAARVLCALDRRQCPRNLESLIWKKLNNCAWKLGRRVVRQFGTLHNKISSSVLIPALVNALWEETAYLSRDESSVAHSMHLLQARVFRQVDDRKQKWQLRAKVRRAEGMTIAALADMPWRVLRCCASVLSEIQTPESPVPLLQTVLSDALKWRPKNYLENLEFDDRIEVRAGVWGCFSDRREVIVRLSARAISRIAEGLPVFVNELEKCLNTEADDNAKDVVDFLGELGPRAATTGVLEGLLRELDADQRYSYRRDPAVKAIQSLATPTVNVIGGLVRVLENDFSPHVAVAQTLSSMLSYRWQVPRLDSKG